MQRISLFMTILLIGVVSSRLLAQTADLRLSTQVDCEKGQYLATIQIRASDATSFSIGTSSVFLSYDPSSLTFASYQSLNFDNNSLCGGQSLWDSHSFDGSSPGLFNLTMVLNSSSISCPLITSTDWVSIGTIIFQIRNPDGNPTLLFNPDFSSFNAVPANNGLNQILPGQYTGVNQASVLRCTPICSLTMAATPGSCNASSNQYTLTGTVSLHNAVAGNLVITDGNVSTTVSVVANQPTASFLLTGLNADGVSHTVSASLSGCSTVTTSYVAPVSCTALPCASASCVPMYIVRLH
ncbi:hypothetical protein [Spirosoma litoris]